ncbi:hypothetical protein LLH00_16145 [bacterium]|nr:hypothetical protein [bacterium]
MRLVTTFFPRLWRALILDPSLYEEVRDDKKAIWQAIVVVYLTSVSVRILVLHLHPGRVLLGPVSGFAGWLLWSLMAQRLAPRLFRADRSGVTYGQVLRPLGFAYAPGLLAVTGIFYDSSPVLAVLLTVWIFLSFSTAVRQSLGYSNTVRAAAAFGASVIVLLAAVSGIGLMMYWMVTG